MLIRLLIVITGCVLSVILAIGVFRFFGWLGSLFEFWIRSKGK